MSGIFGVNNAGRGSAEMSYTPFTTQVPLRPDLSSIAQQHLPSLSDVFNLDPRLQATPQQNRSAILPIHPLHTQDQQAQKRAKANIRRRVKENAQVRSYRAQ
jgi:hypothetical protein